MFLRSRKNQPIMICDLTVHHLNRGEKYGEADRVVIGEYKKLQLERLAMYIGNLANTANDFHIRKHGKNDRSNHITRLSTQEFDLFTAVEPISSEDFNALRELLQNLVEQMHPNVHLVLNTFAVKDKNGAIDNVSLYLVGGKEGKVFSLYKPLVNVAKDQVLLTYDLSSEGTSSKPACYNSIFTVKTATGAEYTQAVEVDAEKLKGRLQSFSKAKEDLQYGAQQPTKVDHLVISKHVKRDISKLSEKDAYAIPATRSRSSRVVEKVTEHVFGGSYEVVASRERKIGKFHGEMKEAVDKWNQEVTPPKFDENNLPSKISDDELTEQMNAMFEKLFDKFRYNFFERLFNYGHYKYFRFTKDALTIFQIALKKDKTDNIARGILGKLNELLRDSKEMPRPAYIDDAIAIVNAGMVAVQTKQQRESETRGMAKR